MYTLIAAAIRVLPDLLPQIHHSSFTHLAGRRAATGDLGKRSAVLV